jgi:hypothetical protein
MTELHALWLPILLSSVFVFLASSVIHMASPWHKSDYPKLPNEDKVIGRTPPAGHPARRLHAAAPVEPEGRELTRVLREVEKRTGHGAHGDAERPIFDGQESQPLVYLLRSCRDLRRLHCGARAGRRCAVPERLPLRRRHCVRRILNRSLADVDLVLPRLEHDDQVYSGRADLRAPHGRHIRMAVAPIVGSA